MLSFFSGSKSKLIYMVKKLNILKWFYVVFKSVKFFQLKFKSLRGIFGGEMNLVVSSFKWKILEENTEGPDLWGKEFRLHMLFS